MVVTLEPIDAACTNPGGDTHTHYVPFPAGGKITRLTTRVTPACLLGLLMFMRLSGCVMR